MGMYDAGAGGVVDEGEGVVALVLVVVVGLEREIGSGRLGRCGTTLLGFERILPLAVA